MRKESKKKKGNIYSNQPLVLDAYPNYTLPNSP